MSKMIQLRNVPDALHKQLKIRAAEEGMSLSDWSKKELSLIVQRPSRKEWLAMAAKWPPIETTESVAEIIREMRESR